MAGFSNIVENALLDHFVSTYGPSMHLALTDADPLDDASGTFNEPATANGYARVAFNNWTAAANGSVNNAGIITFPVPTASWGNLTHVVLVSHVSDAISQANILMVCPLSPALVVGAGTGPTIAVGALTITLD